MAECSVAVADAKADFLTHGVRGVAPNAVNLLPQIYNFVSKKVRSVRLFYIKWL